MLRILLATDSEILRRRLLTLIADVPQSKIISDVSDEAQVIHEVRSKDPDAVVISFSKLGQSKAKLLRTLRSLKPTVPIIALSSAFNYVNNIGWQKSGASYVFDLTSQIKEFCDCLTGIALKSEPGSQPVTIES